MIKNIKTIHLVEKVVFGDFSTMPFNAKIDTGAETGAMHAEDIQLKKQKDGRYLLTFRPFGLPETISKDCFRLIRVRSSNGTMQQRFSILTKITIDNTTYSLRITLADRSDMTYPVIIGRRFLKNKFVVDPR